MRMNGCHITTSRVSGNAAHNEAATLCGADAGRKAMAQKPADLDYRELQRECKAAGVNAKGCVAQACLPSVSDATCSTPQLVVQPAAECSASSHQPLAHTQGLFLLPKKHMNNARQ